MTQMSGVRSAAPVVSFATGGSGDTAPGAVPSNSLPPPAAGEDDPAVLMNLSLEALLMMSQAADSGLTDAKGLKMETDAKERKEKLDKMLAEMKEQAAKKDSPGFFGSIVKIVKDFATDLVTNPAKIASDLGSNIKAAMDSPNFWGDLKKICMKVVEVAAVVAAAAATVFTAGAGGVLVAGVLLAISALNFAQSEFQLAQKLGIDPKIAAGIQLGLAVTAIVLSLGTNAGATVGAARAIKEATTGIQVAGTAVGGAATVADATYQADALHRQARIKQLQSGMDTLQDAIKALIEDIGAHKDSSQAVTKNFMAVIDQQNQTTNSISTMRA